MFVVAVYVNNIILGEQNKCLNLNKLPKSNELQIKQDDVKDLGSLLLSWFKSEGIWTGQPI